MYLTLLLAADALFLILAATNLELIRLLPWSAKSRDFDGLPTAGVLKATYISTFTEDVPQVAMQITYLVVMSNFGALRGNTLLLSVVSLLSAVGSTLWRGLRKFIITVTDAETWQVKVVEQPAAVQNLAGIPSPRPPVLPSYASDDAPGSDGHADAADSADAADVELHYCQK